MSEQNEQELGVNEYWGAIDSDGKIGTTIGKRCPPDDDPLMQIAVQLRIRIARVTLIESSSLAAMREREAKCIALIERAMNSTWESAAATERILSEALSLLEGTIDPSTGERTLEPIVKPAEGDGK